MEPDLLHVLARPDETAANVLQQLHPAPLGVWNGHQLFINFTIPHSSLPNGTRLFDFEPQAPPPRANRGRPRLSSDTAPRSTPCRSQSPRDSGYGGSAKSSPNKAQSLATTQPSEAQRHLHFLLGRLTVGPWINETLTNYVVTQRRTAQSTEQSELELWIMADDLLRPVEQRGRPDNRRGLIGIDGTKPLMSRPSCAKVYTTLDPKCPIRLEVFSNGFKFGKPGAEVVEPEMDEARYHDILDNHGMPPVDAAEAERWHNRHRYGPRWRFKPRELWPLLDQLTLKESSGTSEMSLFKIRDGVLSGVEQSLVFRIDGMADLYSFRWLHNSADFCIPECTENELGGAENLLQSKLTPGTAVAVLGAGGVQSRPSVIIPLRRLIIKNSAYDELLPFFFVRDLSAERYGLLASACHSEEIKNGGCTEWERIGSEIDSLRTACLSGGKDRFSYATLDGMDWQATAEPTVKLRVIFTDGFKLQHVIRKDQMLVAASAAQALDPRVTK